MLFNALRLTSGLLALSSLVAAQPIESSPSTSLSCGLRSKTQCASYGLAESPCNGETDNPCNQTTYFAWPGVFSYHQCQQKCAHLPGCESFSYKFVVPQGEEVGQFGPAPSCSLFTHPVANYTVSCSKRGSTKLDIYYDVGCTSLPMLTEGTVPTKPNNNTRHGTCNSLLSWNGNNTQWARINIKALPVNVTQAECAAGCRSTSACKSYYYGTEDAGYHMYPLSNKETYTTLFEAPECILLSQPVSEYVSKEQSEIGSQFYDLNCPIVDGSQ